MDEKQISLIKSLKSDLSCYICKQIIVNPVKYQHCQHSFCGLCFSSIANKETCPQCGLNANGMIVSDKILNNFIKYLHSTCTTLNIEKEMIKEMNKKGKTNLNDNEITAKDKLSKKRKSKNQSKKSKLDVSIFKVDNSKKLIDSSISDENDLTENVSKKLELNVANQNFAIASLNKNNSNTNSTSEKNIEKRNNKGETLLHNSCIKGNVNKLKILLELGAIPNTKDNAGWTPLQEAADKGYEEIVNILLDNGANPDMPGYGNSTPLHMAVDKNHLNIAKMLLDFGCNPEARNIYNITPRSLCRSEEMKKILNTTSKSDKLISLSQNIIARNISFSKIIIYCQDLQNDKIEKLSKIINTPDLHITRSFKMDQAVTHVIVNTKNDFLCELSTSVLLGLLLGKWIISDKWIEEGGNIENFEIKGTTSFPTVNAARRARISFVNQLPRLFNGCHFFFWGPITDANIGKMTISRYLLNIFVEYGGGTLLKREPNPELIADTEKTSPYHVSSESCLKTCSHYIIYNSDVKEPLIKYNMLHVKSLPLQWMIDCIANYKIIDPV